MSSPTVLQKLGDKVSRYVSGIKTLPPEDSEVKSLEANQEQVDALAGKPHLRPIIQEEMTVPTAQPTDATRYGSRGGEKRYMVDPQGNLTEIPMAKPQHVDHYSMTVPYPEEPAMKPIIPQSLTQPMSKAPVYDDGGDVATKQMNDADAALAAGASRDAAPMPAMPQIPQYTGGKSQKPQPVPSPKDPTVDRGLNVLQPSYMPGGGPNVQAPAMPKIELDMSKAPVFDEGGDVDVNDGKHSIAVVEDGERVLTPAQNDQFKKEHPDEAAAHAQPTQTTELRPFSEVKAEKDKAQAPQPALKTMDSTAGGENKEQAAQVAPPAPEQLPTASHAERVAIKADQQKAMGQGVNGLTQLGLANIHAKQLGLKGLTEDAEPGSITDKMTAPAGLNGGEGGPQAQPAAPSAPGMPQIPAAAPAAPNTSSEQGKDFKTRLAQLKLDHAKALAERTPEGKVQADYIQEQINDLHKNNPYGTEGNHDSWLGKLGHVAAKVGNIAGNIVAPSTMALIPGTELNKQVQEHKLQGQTAQDEASLAAQDKADKTSGIPGYKQVTGGAIDPKNPDAGSQVAFYNEKDPSNIVYGGPLTPKTTPAQSKQEYQKVLAKIGTPDAADPAQQMKALEAAHASGVITDDEFHNSIGYLGANNAPATQATTSEEKRVAGKTLYYNTPQGRVAYTPAEAKAEGLNPSEGTVQNEAQVSKDREKSVSYNSITKALTQYQRDIDAGNITDLDRKTLATVVEESESPDYISKLMAGAFDAVLGHPITGYSEKLSKGVLTKNQYQDMTPAGRQLLADYYTAMMAHFANVKAIMGSIPRNEKLLQTEMHTIPKPYLNGEEAKPTFQNYQDFMHLRNADNVQFNLPNEAASKKEEEKTTEPTTRPRKATTAKPAAKTNNGYSVNNPFAPKPNQP